MPARFPYVAATRPSDFRAGRDVLLTGAHGTLPYPPIFGVITYCLGYNFWVKIDGEPQERKYDVVDVLANNILLLSAQSEDVPVPIRTGDAPVPITGNLLNTSAGHREYRDIQLD